MAILLLFLFFSFFFFDDQVAEIVAFEMKGKRKSRRVWLGAIERRWKKDGIRARSSGIWKTRELDRDRVIWGYYKGGVGRACSLPWDAKARLHDIFLKIKFMRVPSRTLTPSPPPLHPLGALVPIEYSSNATLLVFVLQFFRTKFPVWIFSCLSDIS